MTKVLIVDDNPIDRFLAAEYVKKEGVTVEFAGDGEEALALVVASEPDVVVTDMQMPKMDGLELVKQIKEHHAGIPVILMTAHGSEEIASKALHLGAASYVPKVYLRDYLANTVHNILRYTKAAAPQKPATPQKKRPRSMTELSERFELSMDSDEGHEPLIEYFQEELQNWGLCDDNELVRVGTALHECFVNAIEHGNLELNSALREDMSGAYHRTGSERRRQPPYSLRKVFVTAVFHRTAASFVIRDQGNGFDPKSLPDPTDPENIGKISGRGLLLIQTFMDEVRFNDNGTEITMVKKRTK